MNLTIVIPFFNGHAYIGRLIESIPSTIPVVVVDDLSERPLRDLEYKNVRILRPRTKGYFTGACNIGIEATNTDVLILNQDTYFTSNGWLDVIQEQRDDFALIGERISGNHPAFPHGYIHGTFMFARRDAIEEVGLMNADLYPLWGSTAEWQLRFARKGFSVKPLTAIEGFVHERGVKPYGSSIEGLLRKEPQSKRRFITTPPLVSVVTGSYNYGRFLPDLIHSLIGGQTSLGHHSGQTLQSFELIVVDDGSTDETAEIMQDYNDGWLGIKYIQQENGGNAQAMNNGIKHATGKVIAAIDADDMMHEERLERMYTALQQNPHSVIVDALKLFGDGKLLTRNGEVRIERMRDYDFDTMLIHNLMHKGIMYPKKAWREAGGYPENMIYGREDWAFNVALGMKGYCGVNLKEYPGYLYRREGHNRTTRNTTPEWRNRFKRQMIDTFPQLYGGKRPMGCCGNGKRNGGNKATLMGGTSMVESLGEEGMTLIQYQGGNAGNMTFWGKATNTRYVFGGSRAVGYVDSKDIPGFLDMYEAGRNTFKVVVQPAPKPAPATLEEEPLDFQAEIFADEENAPVASVVEEQSDNLNVQVDTSILDGTVTQFEAWLSLNDLTEEQAAVLLEYEKANKNRVSVIGKLENAD